MIEGQLKEKSGGKWKIFKKWKSRYFTLSGKFDQFSKIISASGRSSRSGRADILHSQVSFLDSQRSFWQVKDVQEEG